MSQMPHLPELGGGGSGNRNWNGTFWKTSVKMTFFGWDIFVLGGIWEPRKSKMSLGHKFWRPVIRSLKLLDVNFCADLNTTEGRFPMISNGLHVKIDFSLLYNENLASNWKSCHILWSSASVTECRIPKLFGVHWQSSATRSWLIGKQEARFLLQANATAIYWISTKVSA